MAAVEIGAIRRGHQRDRRHPGQRDHRDDDTRDRELDDAPDRRPRPADQVRQAERGQHHPGLDHLGLEGESDPETGQDEPRRGPVGPPIGHAVLVLVLVGQLLVVVGRAVGRPVVPARQLVVPVGRFGVLVG